MKNISSLIESWCKKKLVFASPLLPFGTVGIVHATNSTFSFSLPTYRNKKPKELFLFHPFWTIKYNI
jgi:hypothetical protein